MKPSERIYELAKQAAEKHADQATSSLASLMSHDEMIEWRIANPGVWLFAILAYLDEQAAEVDKIS